MADTKKGQRWPSNAELDLQRRLDEAKEEDGAARLSTLQGGAGQISEGDAPYAVKDNDTSAYVGVSSEYMTYADDRQKPMRAGDGSTEAAVEERALQATPVRAVSEKDNNQTQGEGTTYESVYTATSGEDFTPERAEQVDPNQSDESTGDGEAGDDNETPEPVKTAAPPKPPTTENK